MVSGVNRILDGVPLDEVGDAVYKGTLLKDLTESFLAQVAEADE